MIKKLFKLIKDNKWLILIILVGAILRLYKFDEYFMYSHDQDLSGWFIKDILVNKHPRLIGQETSTQGIFIGPLFYYSLIPFYIVTNMDPIGGVFLVVILGIFNIYSIYFVLSKVFDKHVGLVSAMLYGISYYAVFNDREVVPTMPVILWTVWFFYALYLILNGKQKKVYLLVGVLFGLIWHLNVALVLLFPTLIFAFYLSKKRIILKDTTKGLVSFLVLILPLIFFEVRHGFPQIKSLIVSLTTNQHDIISGLSKVERVIHLYSKNLSGFIWGTYFDVKYEYLLFLFLIIFIYQFAKNKIDKRLMKLSSLWLITFFIFFSVYSKILSEYYLNGAMLPFIVVLSLWISDLLKSKKTKDIGITLIVFFLIVNLDRFINHPVNKSGYVEKKQIISEIKRDSLERGFNCVSISYITDPGYNLGYRYLMWNQELKTKPISETVPVYTIVYPMKSIFTEDKSFGAIGLIYPDYEKYNLEKANKNCKGDDFNLTDTMLGFN